MEFTNVFMLILFLNLISVENDRQTFILSDEDLYYSYFGLTGGSHISKQP